MPCVVRTLHHWTRIEISEEDRKSNMKYVDRVLTLLWIPHMASKDRVRATKTKRRYTKPTNWEGEEQVSFPYKKGLVRRAVQDLQGSQG